MSTTKEIYLAANGQLQMEVAFAEETAWLSQAQMAELFGTQRPAITKHLRNIYQSGELQEQSTCSIMEHMPDRGRSYKTTLYNLDAIISVGYRVNSTRATQFRQWATRTLKQHLTEGYTLNQRRLQERGIELEQAVALLSQTLTNQQLVNADGAAVVSVISDYARSWSLLQSYDEGKLAASTNKQSNMRALALADTLAALAALKQDLIAKGEATPLFGQLRSDALASAASYHRAGLWRRIVLPQRRQPRRAPAESSSSQLGGKAEFMTNK